MRAKTNLSIRDRKQAVLSDFRGVDFSTSPLLVQANRATDMENFINVFGKSEKRNGWCQIHRLSGRINGIFPYRNGSTQEFLVYAGTRFYRIQEINGEYTSADVTENNTDGDAVRVARLTDTRCQAFYSKGFLFIIGCGDYLQYGSWDGGVTYELRRVTPYIPTTTIDINHTGVADSVRGTLDLSNILTLRRYNKLVGAPFEEGQTSLTWLLDSADINYGSGMTVDVETVREGATDPTDTVTRRYIQNFAQDSPLNLIDEETGAPAGFIVPWEGKLTLTVDTAPPIEGMNNITVCFAVSGKARDERIRGCSFGTLFGVGGNADRLFLAGNAEFPNVEFFSEMEDFTYFPDQYTATFGTDEDPITAFMRLSDNALAVFKRYNGRESSVYYQTGEYRTTYDTDGNVEKITPVFSITAGATGESAVNPYTVANFAGDNLILSENGVFAIELTENVATDARTARERSRAINAKLIQHASLEDAVGIVYKGKYYLCVDGVCYVADARYKYQPQDSPYFNYEWWYWTNIHARVWAEIGGRLWFGTSDGRLCRFDLEYTDRTNERTAAGGLTINYEKNRITHSPLDTPFSENDVLIFDTEGVFAVYLDRIVSVAEHRIFTSESDILSIYEGAEVYADGVGDSALQLQTPYYVADTDRAACSFSLADGNGVLLELAGVGENFRLVQKLSGNEAFLTAVDQQAQTFGLKRTAYDTEPLVLTVYGEAPSTPIAELWHYQNVVARWTTPTFDFGTNEQSKTLLKLTVSVEPQMRGRLTFGYETRKSRRELTAEGMQGFSFENFDFSNFSFETGFHNSYSVKVKERNFNYIVFHFVSDSDTNCSINDFTVTYKINSHNLGVK